MSRLPRLLTALALATLACGAALAQEAQIRKNLAERLTKMPKIDEVSRTPIAGLWEVRYGGTELLYSDEKGDFILINGSMFDTKTQTDRKSTRLNSSHQ